jgi:hypothetical protein
MWLHPFDVTLATGKQTTLSGLHIVPLRNKIDNLYPAAAPEAA